jgi:RNA polymerase sigma factor (sigma-70 family)
MASRLPQVLLRQIRQLVGAPATSPVSDRQLLERFATRHEEAAFQALVQRHGTMVLGVGRRVLGDAHAAEDIFQATFLVLARKASSMGWQESVGPWLYGVAYRLAVRTRADLRGQRAHESRVVVRRPPEPEEEVARHEQMRILDEEVQRLPERYRAPVVLCYLEGRTSTEAAQQLGWSLGTTKGRLARARALLRSRLTRRGVVPAVVGVGAVLGQPTVTGAVPASLVGSTARIAGLLAAEGSVAAGGVAAPVAHLTEGMLHALFLSQVKVVALVLVGVVLVGSAALLTHQALAVRPPAEVRAERSQPADGDTGPSNPEAEPQARTDRHGDPLPPGAIARLGTVRFLHGGDVRAVPVTAFTSRM